MVNIYTIEPKVLLENYACVKSALFAAEQHAEKSMDTFSTYMAYYYPFAVDEMLKNSRLSFMVAKLTEAEKDSFRREALDYIKVQGKSAIDSDVDIKRGHLIWKKYCQLKGMIMNEIIPAWNHVVQSNSGKHLEEVLRLFRKRLFYELLTVKQKAVDLFASCDHTEVDNVQKEVQSADSDHNEVVSNCEQGTVFAASGDHNEAEGDDSGRNEVKTLNRRKQKEFKSRFLEKVDMPEDWYPPSYLPFLIFGPPAAPDDCPVFRREMSSRPKPKSVPREDVKSAESCLVNMDQLRSSVVVSGTCGGTLSRAKSKNRDSNAAQEALDSMRHAYFTTASQNYNKMSEYFEILEKRSLRIQGLKVAIELAVELGKNEDYIRQLRLELLTFYDENPIPAAPKLTYATVQSSAKRKRNESPP